MSYEKPVPAEESDEYLADLPAGPLDLYRKSASFDWKLMRSTIEQDYITRFKWQIWKTLENDPLFAHSRDDPSLEETRRITTLRTLRVNEYNFVPKGAFDPNLIIAANLALGQYDWSVSLKKTLLIDFFQNAIRGSGTKRHSPYMDLLEKNQILGCFALTEIGHGTNTRETKTRATFNSRTRNFILHTPGGFENAKCWSGNLGKTATHGVVFAQLYTPDGTNHGLHSFVVALRNPNTMETYPGITIGDMGGKLGLNGLDNGFMIFDNYSIPYESLLNKNGDVTLDGKYVTPFKDPNKRFGASLGNLSAGRVSIISICTVNLYQAITIAIRYSAVRKQFGSNGGEDEQPVIEYQLQQYRLFPYLAASYILKHFGEDFFQDYVDFVLSQMAVETDEEKDRIAIYGAEIHALSSAGKPLAGWLARDGIQESREACGGHGYLTAAGIGRLRNDHDANCTYEGDNNVLLQQTSNWLISIWANPKRNEIKSPLGSLDFLQKESQILKSKFQLKNAADIKNPNTIIEAYDYLICWLLQKTSEKFHSFVQEGKDVFTARNDSQVYKARTLAIVYIESFVLKKFLKLCNRPGVDPSIKNVLLKLFQLYGLWSLEKHLAILYEAQVQGSSITSVIHEAILELCLSLKTEAVALVDVLAPPDFILNSILGNADGNVYKNIQQAFTQSPGTFERPTFWKEIVESLRKSKL